MMRCLSVLALALVLACADRPAPPPDAGPAAVRPGAEVVLDSVPAALRARRVGLITNHSGIDRERRSTIDLLSDRPEFELVALYSPEHGIRGVAAPGEEIESGVDERTGLPIHSLYGETREPTPEMLEGVEALVFDIQDIGTRQYTYISTMALSMGAAAEKGIPFVVLDRPNPITGAAIEGNLLDPDYSGFIGIYPLPVRHGMTVGELARLFNAEFGIGAQLTVVPVEGWTRDVWFDETGLPWVNPSPNIRSLEAATHYPGTVFFETTNVSEGRGTERPFVQIGAPWLDNEAVIAELEAYELPGVRFEPIELTVEEDARKYPGERIRAIRFVLTDRDAYRPVRTSIRMIDVIRRLHPDDFDWRRGTVRALERHAGGTELGAAIEGGTLDALFADWERDEARFREQRAPYLLYE